MGRSLPPVTQLMLSQIAEVKHLYVALRRSDQVILDSLFDSVQPHRAAIANAANLLPLEAMFILMLLEERKHNQQFQDELLNELSRLRHELQILKDAGA